MIDLVSKRNRVRWTIPLIPTLGSHTTLIPAPRRWKQELIWLGRKRNIRQEETRGHYIQSENLWRHLVYFGLRIR